MFHSRVIARAAVVALVVACANNGVAWADTLTETVRVMAATPAERGRVDLAVDLLSSGHVTLVNRTGERMTASLQAQGGELARAVGMLAPDTKTGSVVVFHFSASMLFTDRTSTLALLNDASFKADKTAIKAVVAGKPYTVRPMIPNTDAARGPTVEVLPTLHIQTRDARLFAETVQQLERPLKRSDVRIIALTPGAPGVLSVTPRMAPDGKTALVDAIDPSAAKAVVSSSRRQTLIFTGSAVPWTALLAAARGTDTTLVHIDTGSAAQPGGRNFLWLPVKSPLQKASAEQITLADLMSISLGKRIGLLRPESDGARLLLTPHMAAFETEKPALGRWLGKMTEIASDLIGNAPPRAITVSMPTAARQAELDRRFVSWLPSWLQLAYPLLLLIGLAGLPIARQWFARIWPEERASDYAGAGGHVAARIIRSGAFWLIFVPAVALAAAPARLLKRFAD